MNIFITGSKGFIGTHLYEYLSESCTDCTLFTPSSAELDLIDEKSVNEYILSNKIDIIVHLANRGGGRDNIKIKNITEYNLRIFFNIVKQEKNVQKIISFGSGAEYAKHKPIIDVSEEDYLLEQPLDEYGFYKSVTSKYIEKSKNIVQLRIFGCYGEKENYQYKFISNAIIKNLFHLPITINQNVYFDYIYINDLIKLIKYFIFNTPEHKLYNVTRGEKISLLNLVDLINKTSEYKSKINISIQGLNNEYTSSNNRLMQEIKYFEFTPHEVAIQRMRAYFRYNIDTFDKEKILKDSYIKKINQMWKKV